MLKTYRQNSKYGLLGFYAQDTNFLMPKNNKQKFDKI